MHHPRLNRLLSVKKTYYLAFEGERTENRYFSVLISGKVISRKARMVRLQRDYVERSYSNPRKIIDLLIDYKLLQETGQYTTNLFASHVLDFVSDSRQMDIESPEGSARKYWKGIKTELQRNRVANDKMILDFDRSIEVAANYLGSLINRKIVIDLSDYREPFADPSIEDEYCLIVDRDEKSFTEEQVAQVAGLCDENNVRLIITNPCFELWLMLHFPEITRDMIFKSIESKNMKLVLSKYSRINDGRIDADEYVPRIGIARRRLEDYSQDLQLLKKPTSTGSEVVGSNIGYLIDDLTDRCYL